MLLWIKAAVIAPYSRKDDSCEVILEYVGKEIIAKEVHAVHLLMVLR